MEPNMLDQRALEILCVLGCVTYNVIRCNNSILLFLYGINKYLLTIGSGPSNVMLLTGASNLEHTGKISLTINNKNEHLLYFVLNAFYSLSHGIPKIAQLGRWISS